MDREAQDLRDRRDERDWQSLKFEVPGSKFIVWKSYRDDALSQPWD